MGVAKYRARPVYFAVTLIYLIVLTLVFVLLQVWTEQ